uniref:LRRCT domain-containing protein n=1 Tax=Myripristis murdjan TaxID=586833 RepID=A0A668AFA9_9TELE
VGLHTGDGLWLFWGVLLLFTLLVRNGLVDGCVCPAATVLAQFPSEIPAEVCCLNYSGSAFSHIPWPVFTNETNVEILDLSNCSISYINGTGVGASMLKEVFLNHNRLNTLPEDFLADQPSLRALHLGGNQLQELPEGFLRGSDNLQEVDLQGNQLSYLPGSVLQKPSLMRLGLDGNPWDCSCMLLESLEAGSHGNRTTSLHDLVGNLTCTSPMHLAGRVVWSVKLSNACRPPGLTALFILLPLLILSALLLCWCCGRKKRKETSTFSASKKRASSSNCNGQKHRAKQQPAALQSTKAGDGMNEGILKNQLLLRPASTLLGSTRDIYEEVEIKLGSVESLPRASSHCSTSTEGRQGTQGPEGGNKAELDTVSVTEVMKDSADREKAYLTQSTEYYSLVPGIELEDSDHGEYESVDLS